MALSPLLSASATVVIHVSPTGKDSNTGSLEQPVATVGQARDLLRSSGRLGKETAVVRLADGVYYLPETFELDPADSGTAAAPVTYEAVNEGKAIISGGFEAILKWEPWRDGIFKATIPTGIVEQLRSTGMDQVYVNGQRQRMARFPNAIEGKTVFDRWDLSHEGVTSADPTEDPLAQDRVSRWSNPAGAYLHLMHPALWGDVHYRVTGKKSDGTLDLEGGWQNNRPTPLANLHKRYRFVENVFEELDAAGEWFYQANEKTLYYLPAKGVDLASAKIEFVRLRHLVELRGSRGQPVKSVTFRGLTFRHAARTFMDNKEPLLRSDWTVYRGGAVMLNGTENCAISDCVFDQVGGNTIFVDAYNRRVEIRGCLIRDSGANGIAFWEFTAPLVLDSGAVGFIFKTPPADPAGFNGPAFTLGADINQLSVDIFATNAVYTESGMSFMTPPHPERIDDHLRIAILRPQHLLRNIQIRYSRHCRRGGGGQRWRRRRNRHSLFQSGSLPRAELLRLFPQAPASGGNQGYQRKIQQPQFPLQNRDVPFCSGTSLRGMTPERVRRTTTVFSFGLAEVMRISLVASSAFSEVSAARKFTKRSMPDSKDTATDTSP
jgi:hypothetical protein